MREVDVVDEEAPGTGGSSWNSSNRRRRPPGTGGSDLQIGAAPAMIERMVGWRRGSERWGVRWCAQINEERSPFIGEGGCCGAETKSTCARRLRRLVELGGDAVGFSSSRQSYR